MATSTQQKSGSDTDLSKLLGVEVKDVDPSANIRIQRGRSKGADVLAIRDVLRECVKTSTVKAFTVAGDDQAARIKKKDELIRKIRSAADGGAEDNSDLDVGTSWDGSSNTLYFGPRDNIDKMMNKKSKGTNASE